MQTASSQYTHDEHIERYARVSRLMPLMEWEAYFDLVHEIQVLTQAHNALVLAHHYHRPDIFHAIADVHGDSLTLAREGAKSDADVIVMCGVRFMAETAKILSPEKTVLLPSLSAGCSLADSITAEDVRALRAQYPGTPVVCYVNTDAAVKAECDACCTSANAIEVVERLGADQVIFVPDEFLAAHVAANTRVRIISWRGHCEVHERFTAREVHEYRRATGAYVIAHPECPRDVQLAADYVGSTSGMIKALRREKPARAVLITECSMADNVCSEFPETEFVRPCNLCPHMQAITLPGIRDALAHLRPAIEVPLDIARAAKRSIDRMFELTVPPVA